jgi:hypothetical protein
MNHHYYTPPQPELIITDAEGNIKPQPLTPLFLGLTLPQPRISIRPIRPQTPTPRHQLPTTYEHQFLTFCG